MKVLSIKQPWANWLVDRDCRGGRIKQIEVRTWKTNYRGPLAIHVSRRPDTEIMKQLSPFAKSLLGDLYLGCIIGTCNLVDISNYDTKDKFADDILWHLNNPDWWDGRCLYGWVLSNPKKLDTPIPCKGRLGLWEMDI